MLESARLLREGGVLCGDDLELQLSDLSPAGLNLAKKNTHIDSCVVDPVSGYFFHPGVTLAIGECLGPVSSGAGFWAMEKRGNGFSKINLTIEKLFKPIHLNPEDNIQGYNSVLGIVADNKFWKF